MPSKPESPWAAELIYFVEWTSQLTYLLYYVMLVCLVSLLLLFEWGSQYGAFSGVFSGTWGPAVILALIFFGIILMVGVALKKGKFEKQIRKHAP